MAELHLNRKEECPECKRAIPYIAETCPYCNTKGLNAGNRFLAQCKFWMIVGLFYALIFTLGRGWITFYVIPLFTIAVLSCITVAMCTLFSKSKKGRELKIQVPSWIWMCVIGFGVLVTPSLFKRKMSPTTYKVIGGHPALSLNKKRTASNTARTPYSFNTKVYLKRSIKSPVQKTLFYGSSVTVVDTSLNRWYRVEQKNVTGWVLSSELKR